MADIFDEIASEPKGDVFDQVAGPTIVERATGLVRRAGKAIGEGAAELARGLESYAAPSPEAKKEEAPRKGSKLAQDAGDAFEGTMEGVGSVASQLTTGMVAPAVAGLAGAGELAGSVLGFSKGDADTAAKTVHDVQARIAPHVTMQPKSEQGRAIVEAAAPVMEAPAKIGRFIAETQPAAKRGARDFRTGLPTEARPEDIDPLAQTALDVGAQTAVVGAAFKGVHAAGKGIAGDSPLFGEPRGVKPTMRLNPDTDRVEPIVPDEPPPVAVRRPIEPKPSGPPVPSKLAELQAERDALTEQLQEHHPASEEAQAIQSRLGQIKTAMAGVSLVDKPKPRFRFNPQTNKVEPIEATAAPAAPAAEPPRAGQLEQLLNQRQGLTDVLAKQEPGSKRAAQVQRSLDAVNAEIEALQEKPGPPVQAPAEKPATIQTIADDRAYNTQPNQIDAAGKPIEGARVVTEADAWRHLVEDAGEEPNDLTPEMIEKARVNLQNVENHKFTNEQRPGYQKAGKRATFEFGEDFEGPPPKFRYDEVTNKVVPLGARNGKMVKMFGNDIKNPYVGQYRLVDMGELVRNHPDVQPRDRTRVASHVQISKMAANLDADRYILGGNELDRGPVIVGPDLKIESGAGRAGAILEAKDQHPELYRQFQEGQRNYLEELGIDAAEYDKMLKTGGDPVIVRERITPVADRRAFADEANQPTGLARSAQEKAITDANNLPASAVNEFKVGDNETIEQAIVRPSNAGVRRAFLDSVPSNEHGELVNADASNLSPAGVQRFKAALIAKLYPSDTGSPLLRAITEGSQFEGVKNVQTALFTTAAKFAQIAELVKQGKRSPEVNITGDLAQAMNVLHRLRTNGERLDDYLSQMQIGETGQSARELTPMGEAILQDFWDAKSAKAIKQLLNSYADAALRDPVAEQSSMFNLPPVSAMDMWRAARSGPDYGNNPIRNERGSIDPRILVPQWFVRWADRRRAAGEPAAEQGPKPKPRFRYDNKTGQYVRIEDQAATPEQIRGPSADRDTINYGGPNSPYDNQTVFDPSMPPDKPRALTIWDRVMASYRKDIAEKFPRDWRLAEKVADSPVISATERLRALNEDGAYKLVEQSHEYSRVGNDDWVNAEHQAWDRVKNQGWTEEEALAEMPESMRLYVQIRQQRLLQEQEARDLLGLDPVPEYDFPYVPRRAKDMHEDAVRVFGRSSAYGHELRTELGSFQKERVYQTARQGMENGVEYEDMRNSALYREWVGLRLRNTANFVKELEDRIIFRDREAAEAASKDGKATKLESFVPGGRDWWVRSRDEAVFIKHQFQDRGSSGRFTQYANKIFRNPNLINPLPHFTKNMMAKFTLAGGSPTRLFFQDIPELMRSENSPLVRRFKEAFPYSEGHGPGWKVWENQAGTPYSILKSEMNRISYGEGYGKLQKLYRVLSAPREASSRVLFRWGDPAMRYSLWKQYVRKGMSDQAAANQVMVDLIRYGTRSEVIDLWKGIPMNFFVPWRFGTIVSLLKQVKNHPIRTAALVGAIDYAREVRYRQSGRWTHLPWDYALGPVSEMLKDPLKAATIIPTAALFGPGGAFVATSLRDLLQNTQDTAQWDRIKNLFWGISQFYELPTEWEQYQKTKDPGHLANMVMSALAGEHRAATYSPKRMAEFIPQDLPGMEYAPNVVTPAEDRMHELRRKSMEESFMGGIEHGKMRRDLREGRISPQQVQAAINEGELSKSAGERIKKEAKKSEMARGFSMLTNPDDMLDVYSRASAGEKRTLRPIMQRKLGGKLTPEQRVKLRDALRVPVQ